jgi:ABC-type cobalamin/Fe3+-siderophores transport system ATPase subunit
MLSDLVKMLPMHVPLATLIYVVFNIQDNVVLMGSPGSGKTTVGRILAKKLAMPVIDIDDDFLESYWDMPVAQKVCLSTLSFSQPHFSSASLC